MTLALARGALLALLALPVAGGCAQRLVFLESSHMGLKAAFQPNNPTPAELDLGWRRGLFAMVPQKSADTPDPSTARGSVRVSQTDGRTTIDVVPDPDELVSLYAVYCGNIGFNDPVEIHHFLATGVAASNLLANESTLRALTGSARASGGACARAPRPTPAAGGQ